MTNRQTPICLWNGNPLQVGEQPVFLPGTVLIYEVLRVIDGVPLFWEDHFARMERSARLANVKLAFEATFYAEQLALLISLNALHTGNIKISVAIQQNQQNTLFEPIDFYYPTPEDYQSGVKTDLLFAERQNPQAKIVQAGLRQRANQMIKAQNLYEVLLVNQEGMVTEGSRSNVFSLKGDTFFTPKADQVLLGITRQKVIECIDLLGFSLIETEIRANDISNFDALFLTGTSPKILPVCQLGQTLFAVSQNALRQLMAQYDMQIASYISQKKQTGTATGPSL